MTRKALQDFSFSDGTFIPVKVVSTPQITMHTDRNVYLNFNPWRFVDMRKPEGKGMKHSIVSTSLDYVASGYGRHVCPGRFFAAIQMKTLLAHIVTKYDVKMDGACEQSPRKENAEILFCKRQA